MKVALCLSGFFRNAKPAYEYIKKNIIDKFDTDVFIYGYKKTISHETYKIRQMPDCVSVEEILEMYKPKEYTFNKFNDKFVNRTILKDDPDYYQSLIKRFHGGPDYYKYTIKLVNMYCMYFNVYNCNELRKKYEEKTGTKYDCVIRTRFDMKIESDRYIKFIQALNDNNIGVIGPNKSHYSISDYFAIGKPDAMNKYSDLYKDIDVVFEKFLDELLSGKHDKYSLSETLLSYYIFKYVNMNIILLPIRINFTAREETYFSVQRVNKFHFNNKSDYFTEVRYDKENNKFIEYKNELEQSQ